MQFHTNSSVALTSTFLLVMVASAAGHQDRRNAIRQTWAYSLRNVKVIFLLGQGHDQQTRIQSENDFYNDIIQEDFEVRVLFFLNYETKSSHCRCRLLNDIAFDLTLYSDIYYIFLSPVSFLALFCVFQVLYRKVITKLHCFMKSVAII